MSALHIRGNATAEEVAALLAVLAARGAPAETDAYTRWRRARVAALRDAPRRPRRV